MSLRGVRVAVTRPADQSADLVRALEEAGAHVVAIPLIRVVGAEDAAPLDDALRRIGSYDWIAFSSANAVRFVLDGLARVGAPADALAHAAIACVGPATADALRTTSVEPTAIPDAYTGAEIAGAMSRVAPLAGSRILWPRAEGARATVATSLRAAGAIVDDPVAYRTVRDAAGARRLAEVVLQKGVDVLTFASPSAVHAFAAELAEPGAVQIAVIGPVTAAAARASGYRVDVTSDEHTAAGLVAALLARYADVGNGLQEET